MAWTYLDHRRPFGMAHRGGIVRSAEPAPPENTVAAFAAAVSLGFRYLETDVHRTADGVLVAFHDDGLERVAGLPGKIADYDWERLSAIELAGGHRIPRLSELLDTFTDARFNVDPKTDDAVDLLIDTVRDHDAVDRVCIGSFSDDRIDRVRAALGPRLCTSPGPKGAAKVLASAKLGGLWDPPFGCLQIPVSQKGLSFDSARLIRQVQDLGLQVHFWTINDADQMNHLLDRGADAIITDEIELLKEVLEARGTPL